MSPGLFCPRFTPARKFRTLTRKRGKALASTRVSIDHFLAGVIAPGRENNRSKPGAVRKSRSGTGWAEDKPKRGAGCLVSPFLANIRLGKALERGDAPLD